MIAQHPSTLALESHLLDPERSPVAAHVAGCARCAERLARMREEGEDFARNVFPLTVAAVERAATRRRPMSWLGLLLPVPALAAVAVAVVLLRPAVPPPDYVGLKGDGGLGLTVYAPGPAGVGAVVDGASVAASSAIRFRVRASAPCHLRILSLDAGGAVSRLFPGDAAQGATIPPGESDLPGGAVLDGKAGPERVWAICTAHALDWPEAERSVRAAASRPASLRRPAPLPGLPPGATWRSLLMEKQP